MMVRIKGDLPSDWFRIIPGELLGNTESPVCRCASGQCEINLTIKLGLKSWIGGEIVARKK